MYVASEQHSAQHKTRITFEFHHYQLTSQPQLDSNEYQLSVSRNQVVFPLFCLYCLRSWYHHHVNSHQHGVCIGRSLLHFNEIVTYDCRPCTFSSNGQHVRNERSVVFFTRAIPFEYSASVTALWCESFALSCQTQCIRWHHFRVRELIRKTVFETSRTTTPSSSIRRTPDRPTSCSGFEMTWHSISKCCSRSTAQCSTAHSLMD